MKWFNRTAQAFKPGFGRRQVLALQGRPKWLTDTKDANGLKSVAPSGRISWGRLPRPEDLGCSL
jgi:hypothetical protein